MKRFFSLSRVALLGLVTLAVSGCLGDENTADQSGKTVTKEDLLHRNFVLTSIDGKDFVAKHPQPMTPNIEFNEGFRISGATCNRFMGQAELNNGVLSVKQLAGTMMMCVDPTLNQLETTFAQMLQAGADISLVDQNLTLRQGGHVLVYKLKDYVQ